MKFLFRILNELDRSHEAAEARRRADSAAEASLRLEGFTDDLGPAHRQLTDQWIAAGITTDQAVADFLAHAGVTEPETGR